MTVAHDSLHAVRDASVFFILPSAFFIHAKKIRADRLLFFLHSYVRALELQDGVLTEETAGETLVIAGEQLGVR